MVDATEGQSEGTGARRDTAEDENSKRKKKRKKQEKMEKESKREEQSRTLMVT